MRALLPWRTEVEYLLEAPPLFAAQLNLTWQRAGQVLGLKTGLNISAVLPVDEFRETEFVLLLTRKGMLKKMPMSRLANINSAGSRAMGLKARPCPHLTAAATVLHPIQHQHLAARCQPRQTILSHTA